MGAGRAISPVLGATEAAASRAFLLGAGRGLQGFGHGDERLGVAFHVGGVDAVFLHSGIPEQGPKEG